MHIDHHSCIHIHAHRYMYIHIHTFKKMGDRWRQKKKNSKILKMENLRKSI